MTRAATFDAAASNRPSSRGARESLEQGSIGNHTLHPDWVLRARHASRSALILLPILVATSGACGGSGGSTTTAGSQVGVPARQPPAAWAERACTILTAVDTSIQSGSARLNQELAQATSLDQARSILQNSFTPTTSKIFEQAINDLRTLGASSSPGGDQLSRDLIGSLSEANRLNDQAADRFAQADISSAADLQQLLTAVQVFLGRQEFDLDLHKPTADRAADTGDQALTRAVRANTLCRARDRQEAAIRQHLSQLYS